jgi:ketosteroid isomerase-like protein
MRAMTQSGRDAATLAVRCIQAIADKDATQLRELFADKSKWELAYRLEGMSEAERIVEGGDRIARFHRGLSRIMDSITFPEVETFAVSDELAFVEFRSDTRTAKGKPYANYYVAKVSAKDGRITHWLEFYDPRPAEMIYQDVGESLASRAGR